MDATIIRTPRSAKNSDRARDPEMHQTRMGGRWYFRMKAHIGVDKFSRLKHRMTCTAANVSDLSRPPMRCCMARKTACSAIAATSLRWRRTVRFQNHILHCRQHSMGTTIDGAWERKQVERWEHFKVVHGKVEHSFRVTERQLGCAKVRYRGSA